MTTYRSHNDPTVHNGHSYFSVPPSNPTHLHHIANGISWYVSLFLSSIYTSSEADTLFSHLFIPMHLNRLHAMCISTCLFIHSSLARPLVLFRLLGGYEYPLLHPNLHLLYTYITTTTTTPKSPPVIPPLIGISYICAWVVEVLLFST